MVSHNGIVGHAAGRLQDFTYEWPKGATLAMFSDGIASHWSLGKYPGLLSRFAPGRSGGGVSRLQPAEG